MPPENQQNPTPATDGNSTPTPENPLIAKRAELQKRFKELSDKLAKTSERENELTERFSKFLNLASEFQKKVDDKSISVEESNIWNEKLNETNRILDMIVEHNELDDKEWNYLVDSMEEIIKEELDIEIALGQIKPLNN